MTAQTIEGVITQLDDIIAIARREKSRIGYFAALYRKVTAKVKEGIAAGRFEDRARMEQFDVIFANRYLTAWEQFQQGQRPSLAWAHAFDTAQRGQALILHDLLLGMNAHINLDLGLAAAQTCPGPSLATLKRDFEEVNNVLASLLDEVQREIAVVSPMFGLIDQLAGYTDEAICNFSMARARATAWRAAESLAKLPVGQQAQEIAWLDMAVTTLGHVVYSPALSISTAFRTIYRAESKDVPRVIAVLSGEPPGRPASRRRAPKANS
jgi:hypothetical protein